MIKKIKKLYEGNKLESNPSDGILLHLSLDKQRPNKWNKTEFFNNKIYGKLGISMNDRKYFTKEEWTKLYINGLEMFKKFEELEGR